MIIETSRFGKVEISERDIINFPEGILGFESEKRFCLFDPNDKTLILWLQSVDNPEISFPILEPSLFADNYQPHLLPTDLGSIDLASQAEAMVYAILTIPSDIKMMTANLKAPVVINPRLNVGRQIVLQDNKLSMKFEMYMPLKRAISHNKVSDDGFRKNNRTDQSHLKTLTL